MKYKKIYIEITNVCNLSCSFCAKHNRQKEFMSTEKFEKILTKIKDCTDYIYLHVMGEPFMHPQINEFIILAVQKGFKVNLTSNGFLLNFLNDSTPLRQLNISMHSVKEQDKISTSDYLLNIFEKCEKLAEKGVYINYRIWRKDCQDILSCLEDRYNTTILDKDKTKTLAKNIFFSSEEEFIWPVKRLGEGNNYSTGTCRALKDHIAILVDGTVVPCCLDNNATIPLGNIFNDSLHKIIASSTYQELLAGFNQNKKIHTLCQNCTFYDQK